MVNMAVELATSIQDQISQDKTRDTESTNILPQMLEGNSDSECLRSELTAVTGRKNKKQKPKLKKMQGCEQRRGCFETRRYREKLWKIALA